jgi:hypothetical protein
VLTIFRISRVDLPGLNNHRPGRVAGVLERELNLRNRAIAAISCKITITEATITINSTSLLIYFTNMLYRHKLDLAKPLETSQFFWSIVKGLFLIIMSYIGM